MTALPPSVNFHLWQPCNMRCRFCFDAFEDVRATVLPRGHLPNDEALQLTATLAHHFDKITFVGGEPTLCPWIPELVELAKSAGATTMIVTNGTRLLERLHDLARSLDWVTISMDSSRPERHVEMGRAVGGEPVSPEQYIEIAHAVRRSGMRLKLNTVVNAINADEDMTEIVARMMPARWKVFQVLPVAGQNDGSVEPLLIDNTTFRAFVQRHRDHLEPLGIQIAAEDNAAMRGTYAMVDPAGRFFDNTGFGYRYSRPILEVGIQAAWDAVRFDLVRFIGRGGVYEWR